MAHDSRHAAEMKRISKKEWNSLFRSGSDYEQEQEDRAAFLDALEELPAAPDSDAETVHHPQLPEIRRLPAKIILELDDELDLHLLTREEAETAVARFLDCAWESRSRLLLIITGKGKHSERSGVLRTHIWKWLLKNSNGRIHWQSPAPRSMGGDGAIVVQLYQRPAEE